MADQLMWSIKAPTGDLRTGFIERTRREVISSFKSCHFVTWMPNHWADQKTS